MNAARVSRYLDVLRELVVRELRTRHKQSLLGPVWIVLSPLLLLAPVALVFRSLIAVPSGTSYTTFVYAGLLPWLFFSESVRTATESLVVNAPLLRRVAFARSLLPLSTVGTRAVEFSLVGAVTLPFFLRSGSGHLGVALLTFPLTFALLVTFAAGLSLATSVLYVYYRDIRHVVQVLLTAWMYATPIIYAPEMLPSVVQRFMIANPLAAFVDAGRSILVDGAVPSWPSWMMLAGWSGASLLLGTVVFRLYRKDIVDVL